jgi:hypothetical protein
MRRTLIVIGIILVVIAVAAGALLYTGTLRLAIAQMFKPNHGWDLAYKAPAPDYADTSAWAARPDKDNLAKLVPAGVAEGSEHAADVFFIHPTGYMNGYDWNSPVDPKSQTEENTKWMMANQASSFNGCCDVYAPRYREMSIMGYMAGTKDIQDKAMDLAYSDVVRAFEYFIAHESNGRPFIIASHSQGTAHAFRLIKEKIDGTPLAQRMVAAYIIGGGVKNKEVDALRTVHACGGPTDLHCINHWATWGEGGSPWDQSKFSRGDQLLCTNPLTWKRDGGVADAKLDHGGVPPSGRFSIKFWGNDSAAGVLFGPLKAPVKGWTHAACHEGLLWVGDQKGGPFDGLDLGGKNYHGLDYPLFHMDIEDNAIARVAAYLQETRPTE